LGQAYDYWQDQPGILQPQRAKQKNKIFLLTFRELSKRVFLYNKDGFAVVV
jgi:hypothetical protein